jgi:hypothetical protein
MYRSAHVAYPYLLWLIREANAAFLPLSGNPDRELLRST